MIEELTDVEQVVLLGPDRRPIGAESKFAVHHTETPLHLAFSLYLFDDAGRVLVTRRALGKATWPGVWTNSCCGHPGVGESLTDAVHRRLPQELGVEVTDLQCALPDFDYRAVDASGIVENEFCPVFTGRLHAPGVHPQDAVRPNAEEVMDWAWTPWDQLRQAVAATPFAFSPWAVKQLAQLPGALGS